MENHNDHLRSEIYGERRGDELEPTKIKCRSIIREFCSNTTAHGLPSIVRSTSRFNCVFWSIVFVGFTGLLIYFLLTAILAYYGYPTSIDIEVISEWPQVFPAFSFCNVSPISLNLFLEGFRNYSIQYNLTNANDSTIFPNDLSDLAGFITAKLNANESIIPLTFPISSMLISCTFNNMPCYASDFIQFMSSTYGSCYTFNAKLKNTSDSSLLLANQYGGDGVLSLSLYIHSHQYLPYYTNGFGIVGLIHDNTQLPVIESAGISSAPGQRTVLTYKKKSTFFLPPPYTTCTKKVSATMQAMFENYNNADYGYSESICYQLCRQVYVYEKCGCGSPYIWNGRKLYIPKLNGFVFANICNFTDPCYPTSIGELLSSPSLLNEYCSDCSEECIIKSFIVQSSSLSAPPDWQVASIKAFAENSSIPLPDDWNTTWKLHIQKNFVGIDVVRESSIVENSTQLATLGFVDLLSNVGGQTGLWIGISFLSIMELVELVYRLIRHEFYVIRHRLTLAHQ